jgi:hypothetical protein
MEAMNRRGKHVALLAAAVGVVVLVAAFAVREPLLEQWYLGEFERDGWRGRVIATEKLGQMRSLRAVPIFLDTVLQEVRKLTPGRGHLDDYLSVVARTSRRALVKIGPRAVPELIRAIKEEDPGGLAWFYITITLAEIQGCGDRMPCAYSWTNPRSVFEPVFAGLRDDVGQPSEVRQIAFDTCDKLSNRSYVTH